MIHLNIGSNLNSKYGSRFKNISIAINLLLDSELEIKKLSPVRALKTQDFSSGRFKNWQSIISDMPNKHIFFGLGSQGDRFLINQSASNGFLYAYASSGIIGTIFYIIFFFLAFFKSARIICKFDKNDKSNFYCSLIILIIILRSFIESSFAVFGVDLMIIVTCLSIINKKIIDNK